MKLTKRWFKHDEVQKLKTDLHDWCLSAMDAREALRDGETTNNDMTRNTGNLF